MPVSKKKAEAVPARTRATTGAIQAKSASRLAGGGESTALDPEVVARLAHSYWEARGCEGGSPEEDWFRAEQELSGRAAKAAAN
jgi:hypothetical protein